MSPGWKWSRFTQDVVQWNRFTRSLLGLCLTMKRIKFAGGSILFHLPIPIVILKGMQQCLQLATLFQ